MNHLNVTVIVCCLILWHIAKRWTSSVGGDEGIAATFAMLQRPPLLRCAVPHFASLR